MSRVTYKYQWTKRGNHPPKETCVETHRLNRVEMTELLHKLDRFGDECSSTCKAMREAIRQKLKEMGWRTFPIVIKHQ